MPRVRKCAIRGCEDRESPRHRFPNPAKSLSLFRKWITLCGDEELNKKEPDTIYRSHRVCHKHFRTEDRASNMYLQKGTVPRLLLPTLTTKVTYEVDSINDGKIHYMQTLPFFIHDHILSSTIHYIIYRDIFLALNIPHAYFLCSVLKTQINASKVPM